MLDMAYEHIFLVYYREITEGKPTSSSVAVSPEAGASSTVSLSPNSYTTQNPGSTSVHNDFYEPCQSSSSSGSVEVSSEIAIKDNGVDIIGEFTGCDYVKTSRALRRLQEQLSLNGDIYQEINSLPNQYFEYKGGISKQEQYQSLLQSPEYTVQEQYNGGHPGFQDHSSNFVLHDEAGGVVDIPLRGITFTWSNNREVGSWARLDRFLVSPIILSWYPSLVQRGLPRTIFDHSAIKIGCSKENWGPRPFRFSNEWIEDKKLMIIKEWAEEKKRDMVSTKKLEDRLAKLDERAATEGWTESLRKERWEMVAELWKAIRVEEQAWKQKSIVKWLLEGYRNTRFFIVWVICAKYGIPLNLLRWEWKVGASSSTFTKVVGGLFVKGTNTAKCLEEGLCVVVGMGDKARLWTDIMVEGTPLMQAFPRIFCLAVNKKGVWEFCRSRVEMGDPFKETCV
ncbi:hypothetical protein Ddye_027029 [Dipteronia dyeriana]|uniref:CG-1 domain-containing protein n=1 Tax=Dipteronia dyeriana TaxID=168575 RepID=A0AAD9TNA3_9ROSI|nr:hypothetical protein Ddye_027029 [Dipteronia dyeriana]